MYEFLKRIRDFADECHGAQLRKYNVERDIVHPERVMAICKEYTQEITTLAAALLHDVLEDTATTEQQLTVFLKSHMSDEQTDRTIAMVIELSDVYTKENYPKWNRRVRKDKEAIRLSNISADAQTIKYADIIDNAPEVIKQDPDFAKSFIPEYHSLLKKMNKGNPELYKRAQDVIDKCLRRLGK